MTERGPMRRIQMRRIRELFERTVDDDVGRELEFHLEMRANDLIAAGWEPSEARHEARRRFGAYDEIEQRCRELEANRRKTRKRADMFDALRQDLRFALRQLVHRPGFTALALLTLAIGVGSVTALFSVLDGVVLRDLPYPEPERIVHLLEADEHGRTMRVGRPNFDDWRRGADEIEAMAAYAGDRATVQVGERAVNATVYQVTRDFFDVFRVPAGRGRLLLDDDARIGAEPVAIVSHDFFVRWLDSETPLDQQLLESAGLSFRVVGVMPPEFSFPAGAEVWYPSELWRDDSDRTAHNFAVVGRLADGVSLAEADATLDALAQRLQREYAGANDAYSVATTALKQSVVSSSRKPLLLLFAAASLVLLVAATNLAGSLLARAIDRRHELAVRGAMGADRGRIVRQLLSESVLLTGLGGLLGLLVARGLLSAIRWIGPGRLPRLDGVTIDSRVFLFAVVVSLLTGVAFGAIPALFGARADLRQVLTDCGRGEVGGSGGRLWNLLVGSEVALALVLLLASGLTLRTLWQLLTVDPGFETQRILTVDVAPTTLEIPTDVPYEELVAYEPAVKRYLSGLLEDVRTTPGITRAGLINSLPLSGLGPNGTFCLGQPLCFDDTQLIGENGTTYGTSNYRVVSEDYFATMGIRLVRGRSFDQRDRDDAPHVAIVNESLARHYWPQQDPIGQLIRPIGMDLHTFTVAEVVGVVADVRQAGLDQEPRRELYVLLRQRAWRARWATVVAATSADENAVVGSLADRLRETHPEIPLEISSMALRRSRSLAEERFLAVLLSGFAGVALLLAATGIWAVASYQIAHRTRELGIRLALGAAPLSVIRLVVTDLTRVFALGAAAGVAAALISSRVLQSQLHGISANDPLTLLLVLLVLVAAAFTACVVPASRAARIDPIAAMNER